MKKTEEQKMFANMYEQVLKINPSKIESIKSYLKKSQNIGTVKAYEIIYLAWLWQNKHIVIMDNAEVLVDVDFGLDLNKYFTQKEKSTIYDFYLKYELNKIMALLRI